MKLVVSKVEAGASLKLYNANGAQVRFTNITSNTQTISVKGLAAGIYYLVIRNGKQTTAKKIVIK